jgi:hypothetical protein
MRPSERLEELDSVFELLLVILSIITAALFQYYSTMIPLEVTKLYPNLTQNEFYDKVNKEMITGLRILFIPLLVLIGSWVLNRLFLRQRLRVRKNFSEFCYLFAFSILTLNVLVFLSTSFPILTLQNIYAQLFSQFSLIFSYVLSGFLVYLHEIPFIFTENIRTKKQKLMIIVLPIISRAILIYTIAWILYLGIFYLCIIA